MPSATPEQVNIFAACMVARGWAHKNPEATEGDLVFNKGRPTSTAEFDADRSACKALAFNQPMEQSA